MAAKIHENKKLRNLSRIFADRFDAGEQLARMLASEYREGKDLFILAIPMGGVPVALKVREKLGCPMDLIVVRKIQLPHNTEAGFGAMTQEGEVFINEALLLNLGLSDKQIETQKNKVREDLRKRNRRLRDGSPFPDLSDKTVVLVDDGLASGYTMLASVHMAKNKNAKKIVVAVPTASPRSIDTLKDSVDEIYCLNIREGLYFAVAEAYKNWRDLDEREVMSLYKRTP